MASITEVRKKLSDMKASGEPVSEAVYYALCDSTDYMECYEADRIRKRVAKTLPALAGAGYRVSKKHRGEALYTNIHCIKSPRLVAVMAQSLGADRKMVRAVVKNVLTVDCIKHDWAVTPCLLAKFNALKQLVGGRLLKWTDQPVLDALVAGVGKVDSTDRARYLRGAVLESGLGVLGFARRIETPETVAVLTGDGSCVSPLAELCLEEAVNRRMDRDTLETELRKHGMFDSELVGWRALESAGDRLNNVHEGGRTFTGDEPKYAARFLYALKLLWGNAPICTRAAEIIASRMLEDSNLAEHHRYVFRGYGFSLDHLAHTPLPLDQLPGLKDEELQAIENR